MQPVNPYAASATTSEGDEKTSPRWLAILVSVVTINLAGAGLLLLRRSRRSWVLPALSIALLGADALFAAVAPRLVVPALVAIALAWAAGVVLTARAPAGPFLGWGKTLLLAAALMLVGQALARSTRALAVEAFQIPSEAMEPTLLVGDRLMVTKVVRSPARGDVVVFKFPLDPKVQYIKRVIGLPGETITIQQNQVRVDGRPLARRLLDEPCPATKGRPCQLVEEQAGGHRYRVQQEPDRRSVDFGPLVIPPGQYFVLGDNRDNSKDSRVWGPLPSAMIIGRAVVTFLSSSPEGQRWGRIGRPVD